MDTEVVIHLMARSQKTNILDAFIEALKQIEGGSSMVVLNKDVLIGARDPMGIRPLMLGKVGDAYCLASETCAFDNIGGKHVRDVEPGEIVIIDKSKVHKHAKIDDCIKSIKPFENKILNFVFLNMYILVARIAK